MEEMHRTGMGEKHSTSDPSLNASLSQHLYVSTNPEAPLTLSFCVCVEAFSRRCGQFNHQSFLRNSTSSPSPLLGDQEMGRSSSCLITWLVPRQPAPITWLSRSFPKITLLSYTDGGKGIFMNNRRHIFQLYCSKAISETNKSIVTKDAAIALFS